MGLSIYYSGTLRSTQLIDDILAEAIDLSESLHWQISELPSAPDIPVRGIVIQPEKCDPIWLTFHSNGNLCSPILFSFLLGKETPEALEAAKQVMVTKTQYAGPETHMQIIKFLRYLSEKYFSFFELNDESRFWETGDEQLCRERFGDGERVMDMLELALAGMKEHPFRRIRRSKGGMLLKKWREDRSNS